jgi:hypothetical protein
VSSEPETWLPVVGFEGYYLISSWGRVRSLQRHITADGDPRRPSYERGVSERIMRLDLSRPDHPQLKLSRDGKSVSRTVRRMIREAFGCEP